MLRKIIFHLKFAFSNEYEKPELYRNYMSIKIGKNARFTGKINFGSEPFLISIGNHVTLAHNVTFHTHDGGVWIFREKYPNINIYGKITIGDNVFIGSNVIILPNVNIGDNVVIGAGSVVTKSIESDSVVAGNPARLIRTVNEYEEKVLKNAIFVDSSVIKNVSESILKHLQK